MLIIAAEGHPFVYLVFFFRVLGIPYRIKFFIRILSLDSPLILIFLGVGLNFNGGDSCHFWWLVPFYRILYLIFHCLF